MSAKDAVIILCFAFKTDDYKTDLLKQKINTTLDD